MLLSDEQITALAGLCALQVASARLSNNQADSEAVVFWGELLDTLTLRQAQDQVVPVRCG